MVCSRLHSSTIRVCRGIPKVRVVALAELGRPYHFASGEDMSVGRYVWPGGHRDHCPTTLFWAIAEDEKINPNESSRRGVGNQRRAISRVLPFPKRIWSSCDRRNVGVPAIPLATRTLLRPTIDFNHKIALHVKMFPVDECEWMLITQRSNRAVAI
jgi:hypothetical protein